jgi:hypothetical protein
MKEQEPGGSSLKFNITAGVLDRARMLAFERMLW